MKGVVSMLPVLHPLAKTAIQLRQSIKRLETFIQSSPSDEYIESVRGLIRDLESARSHIPGQLIDIDLREE
jgi:hypothetical protein